MNFDNLPDIILQFIGPKGVPTFHVAQNKQQTSECFVCGQHGSKMTLMARSAQVLVLLLRPCLHVYLRSVALL